MQLYYFKHPNYGDGLNPFVWNRLLPHAFDGDPGTLFVGIGTLLNESIPQGPRKLVFGAGAGYGSHVPRLDARWKVYWVRGPLTARALGLDAGASISDGALLLRSLELPPVETRDKVSFMPHWRSAEYWDWRKVCESLGLSYIDPCAPVPQVLDQIRQSRLLITEALHGAITADAFRVPWVAVRAYRHVLESKWQDWCASMELDYAPVRLPELYSPSAITAKLARMSRLAHKRVVLPALTVPVGILNTAQGARLRRKLEHAARTPLARQSMDAVLHRALERMHCQLERFRREQAEQRTAV
jgi:succinoglycan biosynthesis protein ExoV